MAQATVPATLRMTWEEFLNFNPEHPHYEWVDGEVIEIMPVEEQHESIVGFLYMFLRLFTQEFNLGRTMVAPFLMRLSFRPSGREPDILFVAKENLSKIKKTCLDGPADLAVEIVSPESEVRDSVTKLAEYEAAGIREYWLIDHRIREAKFYQRNARNRYKQIFPDAMGRYASAVVPGFWLNVNWLWQEPKPQKEALQQLGLMG